MASIPFSIHFPNDHPFPSCSRHQKLAETQNQFVLKRNTIINVNDLQIPYNSCTHVHSCSCSLPHQSRHVPVPSPVRSLAAPIRSDRLVHDGMGDRRASAPRMAVLSVWILPGRAAQNGALRVRRAQSQSLLQMFMLLFFHVHSWDWLGVQVRMADPI